MASDVLGNMWLTLIHPAEVWLYSYDIPLCADVRQTRMKTRIVPTPLDTAQTVVADVRKIYSGCARRQKRIPKTALTVEGGVTVGGEVRWHTIVLRYCSIQHCPAT
jgi:hypothetical protein